jgi:hypothetical protein
MLSIVKEIRSLISQWQGNSVKHWSFALVLQESPTVFDRKYCRCEFRSTILQKWNLYFGDVRASKTTGRESRDWIDKLVVPSPEGVATDRQSRSLWFRQNDNRYGAMPNCVDMKLASSLHLSIQMIAPMVEWFRFASILLLTAARFNAKYQIRNMYVHTKKIMFLRHLSVPCQLQWFFPFPVR